MRGEIFDIEGKTFLAFGGADSWDAVKKNVFKTDIWYPGKGRREEHINWWKEERPTLDELKNALTNLEKNHNKVDVILTHETRTENIKKSFSYSITKQVCKMLDIIYKTADFKQWYFGHHHQNIKITKNEMCIFDEFVKIDDLSKVKYNSEIQKENKMNFDF